MLNQISYKEERKDFMRGKSKLLFLICAFALTFMFAINVKAASAPCCENGTRTLTDAYA